MGNFVEKKAGELRRGDVVIAQLKGLDLVVLRTRVIPPGRYAHLLVWDNLLERAREEQLPVDLPVRVEAAAAPVMPDMTPEGAVVHLAARARHAGAI